MPLNKRRAYSVAAVKAGQAYDLKDNKKWYAAMVKDTNDYKQQRSLQNRSEAEKKELAGWGDCRNEENCNGVQEGDQTRSADP